MVHKQVKDKHITIRGKVFLATVEYYQDRPSRDEHVAVERELLGFKEAQKFLARFPRDIWDGTAHKGRKQPIL
jgi:hypothetical protein